jgi:hypothetical protein
VGYVFTQKGYVLVKVDYVLTQVDYALAQVDYVLTQVNYVLTQVNYVRTQLINVPHICTLGIDPLAVHSQIFSWVYWPTFCLVVSFKEN